MSEDQIRLGGTSSNVEPTESSIIGQVNNQEATPEKVQEHGIPKEYLDTEFQVPTETINLPSLGVFYPNGKKEVTIKYLTASEDDILYSPELIKSGKVLDVLLDKVVMDKDLRPENMLSGDRNYLLVEIRKTGLGSEYVPGDVYCSSCDETYEPTIDLDKLGIKPLEIAPDSNGEYEVELPIMKMRIKFRLLTGVDEKRLAKLGEVKGGKSTEGIKVSKLVTEKYVMQIMEVNDNRDKLYIKKFIAAMPMRDSGFFREYVRRVEPGLDLSYEFECPSCGELEIKDIPITPRLFYPDLDS